MAKYKNRDVIFSPHVHISDRELIIKFQGQSSFTLSKETLTTLSDSLYYSYDKENWIEWDGETTLSSVNNLIYIFCD